MKAAVFTKPGGPENIHIATVDKPKINPNQILIEVKACALNYFDLLVLKESDPDDFTYPFWGGADITGVVAEVGSDVSGFKVGEKVVANPSLYCGHCDQCLAGEESQCDEYGIVGDSMPGGLAEYIALDAANILKMPEDMSFEEVAAAPLAFQTAWRALMTRANIRAGEDVVILGASGGVGSASVQIAKLAGARVIAITSSDEKAAKVKEMGADIILNRKTQDIWAEISKLTNGRGVDVVIENVGKSTWADSLNSLKKGGRAVTYARTTGNLVETDLKIVFWNQLNIMGSTMGSRKEFSDVMNLIFQGRLKPVVDSVFALEDTDKAYQRLGEGNHFGKVVVKVS